MATTEVSNHSRRKSRRVEHRVGEPAPKAGRFAEIIGSPDCPILKRWTLFDGGDRGVKLLVHHFLPNADDRDVHDHPRPFWTLVVRGQYDDMRPCEHCNGEGFTRGEENAYSVAIDPCLVCMAQGVVLNERMRPGTLRLRPATHRHRTKVAPSGCWTIVLMGPLRRRWGFWRAGRWWFWKDYERAFGFGMRCDGDA